jgi:hypothetical protein
MGNFKLLMEFAKENSRYFQPSIIREEGDVDVFSQRRWRTPDSSESEHNSDSDNDDDESGQDSDSTTASLVLLRSHISFLT